jgi:hypothetical protein
MPCVDHEHKNCPAYIELSTGQKCKQPGCQRQKVAFQTAPALFEHVDDDLDTFVIPGKTGGRQGTI